MAGTGYDEYVFPEPWRDLRGHDAEAATDRERVLKEFVRRDGPKSPLSRRRVEAVAMFMRQDEVLFEVDSPEFLIAHLTWSGKADAFMTVKRFPNWAEAAASVKEMATDW